MPGDPLSKTIPCDNCPFRREGGIRLTVGQAREIAESEFAFPCHKTTVNSDDGSSRRVTPRSRMCAGFLIFNEARGRDNSAMQVLRRLGHYNPLRFRAPFNRAVGSVFSSLAEMLLANGRFSSRKLFNKSARRGRRE